MLIDVSRTQQIPIFVLSALKSFATNHRPSLERAIRIIKYVGPDGEGQPSSFVLLKSIPFIYPGISRGLWVMKKTIIYLIEMQKKLSQT